MVAFWVLCRRQSRRSLRRRRSERGYGRIEIVSANGRRIIVDDDVDVDVVLRLVRGLEALP